MPFLVSEHSEEMWLMKNEYNAYFDDYGAKESVIICDHVQFSW